MQASMHRLVPKEGFVFVSYGTSRCFGLGCTVGALVRNVRNTKGVSARSPFLWRFDGGIKLPNQQKRSSGGGNTTNSYFAYICVNQGQRARGDT